MPERNDTPNCLFCRIVAGEEQADVVLDQDEAAAFLDYRPLFPGHCLLVPRGHYETFTDLPGGLVGPFFAIAQRLTRAVEAAMEAEGTFVAMNNRISQSVPHFHVHVVPRRRKDGLRGFFWPRLRYTSDEERVEVAQRIRTALAASQAPQ